MDNLMSEAAAKNFEKMCWDIDDTIETLKREGVVILNKVLALDECARYRGRLEQQLIERRTGDSYCGNETNQVLDNYFMTDPELLGLLYQDITDKVMRRMIDDDYVLISPSARNRRIIENTKFGIKTSGVGWHTDSRYVGGQGIKPSLCYMSILAIDPFELKNGATHYVPRSHLLYKRPQDRDEDLDFESMLMPAGAMAIIDTALWHRVGDATTKSRWGVFNTFGPWFMKPYHRFHEMFDQEQMDGFPTIIRQLLHWDSIPPKHHDESMVTLRRVRKLLNM